jgi:hypothetical protein
MPAFQHQLGIIWLQMVSLRLGAQKLKLHALLAGGLLLPQQQHRGRHHSTGSACIPSLFGL